MAQYVVYAWVGDGEVSMPVASQQEADQLMAGMKDNPACDTAYVTVDEVLGAFWMRHAPAATDQNSEGGHT